MNTGGIFCNVIGIFPEPFFEQENALEVNNMDSIYRCPPPPAGERLLLLQTAIHHCPSPLTIEIEGLEYKGPVSTSRLSSWLHCDPDTVEWEMEEGEV